MKMKRNLKIGLSNSSLVFWNSRGKTSFSQCLIDQYTHLYNYINLDTLKQFSHRLGIIFPGLGEGGNQIMRSSAFGELLLGYFIKTYRMWYSN
jgi:hypothetical protein